MLLHSAAQAIRLLPFDSWLLGDACPGASCMTRLSCRWNAPPGAGPVGVTLEVFSGGSVPGGASAQPLLTQQGWYRMQVGCFSTHRGTKVLLPKVLCTA